MHYIKFPEVLSWVLLGKLDVGIQKVSILTTSTRCLDGWDGFIALYLVNPSFLKQTVRHILENPSTNIDFLI